jgi:uncharacterized protein DUF4389
VPDHPVQLSVADDLQRSRLTVFFRLLLAIPHLIWLALWSIGVFFVAIIAWFVALVTGRLPQGLHDFLGMYVRYATHLGAYLALAANPYPGFTGAPGYPIDISVPERERLPRWKTAFRLLLALPAIMLAATLGLGFGGGGGYSSADSDSHSKAEWLASSGVGGVAAVCAILGWFAIVATGRMPLGLRNLGAFGLGYTAQTYAYVLLLTDRYPNADSEAIGPEWALPHHPVRLELPDEDRRRSRLTVFFRLLLAIPHFVWLLLWTLAAFLAAIANGLVALVRGRSADALHRFLTAYIRYYAHLTAFVTLVANPFPGFVGAPGYPVDIVIDPAERQNRWITLFRPFLVIPALFVAGALGGALAVAGFFGWFASLVTGRMPTGLRNLGAMAIRYHAQTNAYWFVVTDHYPYASPALQPPPEAEPVTEPVEAAA